MTAAPIFRAAVPVTSVVCPSWCCVSQAEHLQRLADSEGMVWHISSTVIAGRTEVWISSTTYADGAPSDSPTDAPRVHTHTPSDWDEGMTVEDAQKAVQAMLAAVALLGEGPTR